MEKTLASTLSMALALTAFGAPGVRAADSAKSKASRSQSGIPTGPAAGKAPLNVQEVGPLSPGLEPLGQALPPAPEAASPALPAVESAVPINDSPAPVFLSHEAEPNRIKGDHLREDSPAYQVEQVFRAAEVNLRDSLNARMGLDAQQAAASKIFDHATRKAMEAAPASGAAGSTESGLGRPAAAEARSLRTAPPLVRTRTPDSPAMTAFTVLFMGALAALLVATVTSLVAGQTVRAAGLAVGAAALAYASRVLSLVGQSLDGVPTKKELADYNEAAIITSSAEAVLWSAAELGTGISEPEYLRAQANAQRALERGNFSSPGQANAYIRDFDRRYSAYRRPRLAALLRGLRRISAAFETKEARFIRAVAVVGVLNASLLLAIVASAAYSTLTIAAVALPVYLVLMYWMNRDLLNVAKGDAAGK